MRPLSGSSVNSKMPAIMLGMLSSPLLRANTYKQTETATHILLNHRNIIQPVETIAQSGKSNKLLYFTPSTPHIFLFSLLLQLLERMQRQERQTYEMINYRHQHFLCQQYRLYSSPLVSLGLLFFASIFSLSGLKRKTE